ncbi:hypothetical protein LSTR_LSTR016692 [Laodelphax striatellus]|uniref:SURP motif domain-containing protein n=1 Tax=Laodelphax striatellus TaxID=195883 RepID=A0A482WRA6_LAOST|nr:hypothetical protein LSTR_LSTR016692 [Laodelphax striatellus]
MDLPKPPQDVELRNIIDKLAQFVARNGPEFEQMTKNKQKGNPKFSFLFGGEHFNYYQYKVTTEQANVACVLMHSVIGLRPIISIKLHVCRLGMQRSHRDCIIS